MTSWSIDHLLDWLSGIHGCRLIAQLNRGWLWRIRRPTTYCYRVDALFESTVGREERNTEQRHDWTCKLSIRSRSSHSAKLTYAATTDTRTDGCWFVLSETAFERRKQYIHRVKHELQKIEGWKASHPISNPHTDYETKPFIDPTRWDRTLGVVSVLRTETPSRRQLSRATFSWRRT